MILTSPRLSYDFLGIRLENPFILSAAPSTDELPIARRGLEAGWAGLILKTTSILGTKVDLAYPMMSAFTGDGRILGMGNIDLISAYHIDEVVKRVTILKKEFPNKMIAASIMSGSKEGWQTLVKALKDAGADLIECSFSCPQGNIGEDLGKMLAQSESATERAASWVKEAAGSLPVLIKITPQVTDIVTIVKAVQRAGCNGVTASNSVPALMGIDIDTLTPIPGVGGYSTYSGLTGPAIKPVTLRTVAEIARNVPGMTISGNGGISNWRDSVELLSVGASNVQICTAVMLYGFDIISDLTSGLDTYLTDKGYNSVNDLVGQALSHLTEHDNLPRQKVRSFVVEEKCIGCGRCYIACRDGGHEAIAWNSEKRLPEISLEKCVGCGLCLLTQPVDGCLEMRNL
ncbi:MAG TPA: NAD-dependent dihydropyrimidine dehydrogenase subunit PreA [candidate division Zixibacteria bacterium]|nr:NAD-dependent dihydropyrimidine dehydrogenase subunit PreA [candidate division Zixibacteria bacterium]